MHGRIKSAERSRRGSERPEVWDILSAVVGSSGNSSRAAEPRARCTASASGLRARARLVPKAVRPHTAFVCQAFSADFDGDRWPVHVPLSFEAQIRDQLSLQHAEHPVMNGRPLATPRGTSCSAATT